MNQYVARRNDDKLRARIRGVGLSKQLKLHQKNAFKPAKLVHVSKEHQEHGFRRNYLGLTLK
jgi:hypothetical protein